MTIFTSIVALCIVPSPILGLLKPYLERAACEGRPQAARGWKNAKRREEGKQGRFWWYFLWFLLYFNMKDIALKNA
jgi:hypothetical protein